MQQNSVESVYDLGLILFRDLVRYFFQITLFCVIEFSSSKIAIFWKYTLRIYCPVLWIYKQEMSFNHCIML